MSRIEALRVLPLYLMAMALPVSVSAGGIGAALLMACALFWLVVDRETRTFLPRTALIALLVLVATYGLATLLASPYPQNWHKWIEEMWLKLLLVAVPLVFGSHRRHVPWVLLTGLAVAVLTSFYGIWQHFVGVDPIRDRSLMTEFGHFEVVGFFGHKLSYAGQTMLFSMLGVSFMFAARGMWTRLAAVVGVLLLLLVLVWTHARGPQLGFLVGVVVFVVALKGRARWAGVGLLAFPVILVAAMPSLREHVHKIFVHHRNVTRLNLWESSWDGIQARPLLGFGPGNFDGLLRDHGVEGFYNTRAHSHNDFLMHGVNAGLLGLLAALAVLVLVTWAVWRVWRQGGSAAWVGLAAVACQVAISVAGLFQVYQTDDEVEMLLYFLLGCGLALARTGQRDRAEV